MQSHIEDQIQVFISNYHTTNDKKEALELKKIESLRLERENINQFINVQLSIITNETQNYQIKIKNMQRENYFINLEIKRKQLIIKKLQQDEIISKQQKPDLDFREGALRKIN